MKAPGFWHRPAGWAAWALSPLGWLYGQVTAIRMRQTGVEIGLPVICVGNFTAGGAGKTPTALWLADLLRAKGHAPFIVSRGYGGCVTGPVRVDPGSQSAAEVGDEPLMMARSAPVIVARHRVEGARLARAQGADCVILDDGLQNPTLQKTISLAVVDAGVGIGNGLCVPAGPLRAPLASQMRHVDMVMIIGTGAAPVEVLAEAEKRSVPVVSARLSLDPAVVAALTGKPLLAFAGIGRPQKFFDSLTDAGLTVRDAIPFPDHHVYGAEEIEALLLRAQSSGLVPVATEKDAVKLSAEALAQITVVPVTLDADDEAVQRILASRTMQSGPFV